MNGPEMFGATGYEVVEMLVDDIQAGVVEIMAPPEWPEGSNHAIALRYTTLGNDASRLLILLTTTVQMGLLKSLLNAMIIHDIGAETGIDLEDIRKMLRDGNGFF